MNKFILPIALASMGLQCFADTDSEINEINLKIGQLNAKIEQVSTDGHQQAVELGNQIETLQATVASFEAKSDSIDNEIATRVSSNTELANSNHAAATEKIQVVETTSQSNIHTLTMWGIWAIVALLLIAIIIYIVLHNGISKGASAIESIREAQKGLEEESVKLDTKLVDLLDKQMQVQKREVAQSAPTTATAVDHTLALKVADEITRIEKNLLRMDPDVKGYKALVKAIERIKNNFCANGYEIVTYMGQPYNEGMRINADFLIDEELPQGTRTITAVSRPQIHYKGELIQKATVTVSQNI